MSNIIMGIKIDHRHEDVSKVQGLLTDHGSIIKTRLGLHNAANGSGESEDGLILLEFVGDALEDIEVLEKSLKELQSVHVKKMVFE